MYLNSILFLSFCNKNKHDSDCNIKVPVYNNRTVHSKPIFSRFFLTPIINFVDYIVYGDLTNPKAAFDKRLSPSNMLLIS